jgi:undecaprenyl phosphate N,N'-diacetylbacillosamine 1-phosphate transferase
MRNLNLCLKRLLDLFGSGLGLVLISPLLAAAMLLIKTTMPGPLFFTQERIGKNNKAFKILKLRTMKVDKKAERTLDFSKDEKRLTMTGRLLRRTKIDELPQLINVFKGDMSLVGPRPTIRQQVENYTEYQLQRLAMRPGMTGLAQVHGNISLTWEQRIEYDIAYIYDFNIILDLKILLKTIAIVFWGEEAFKKEVPVAKENKGNFTLGG